MRRLIRDEHGKDEIDRVLLREEEVLPSSGFAVSVMDAVRREATPPPPIPFPWKRALPGLVVAGLALALVLAAGVAIVAQLARTPASGQFSMPLPSLMPRILPANLQSAAGWTALALVVAFVSVKVSMRLASGRA